MLCNLCKSLHKCMRSDNLLKSHLSLWLPFLSTPLCMSLSDCSLSTTLVGYVSDPHHHLGEQTLLVPGEESGQLSISPSLYLFCAPRFSVDLSPSPGILSYLFGWSVFLISLELHSSVSLTHTVHTPRPFCRHLSLNPIQLLAQPLSHPLPRTPTLDIPQINSLPRHLCYRPGSSAGF